MSDGQRVARAPARPKSPAPKKRDGPKAAYMEDDPIRMFVTTYYRAALLALITIFFAAASV